VPVEHSESESESSDPEPESDLDEVATTLAIGKKYFLTKKRKREFEDDGYNRYAFDDRDELPPWFVQDENRHNKPQRPITKEEVEEMKAKFKELNERPIKKVAEAKARKKLRMVKKVEKMKQKAAKIATAEGMSEREKIKSIRTLQVRAQSPTRCDAHTNLVIIITYVNRNTRWARRETPRLRRCTS
jgi:AdoMet-dependent rRNA methyltransferase SPB1